MKLSKKEMEIIGKNLNVKKCPICGAEDRMHVYENVVDMVSMDGNEDDEVEVIETIMVMCPKCGYMMPFSKEFIFDI